MLRSENSIPLSRFQTATGVVLLLLCILWFRFFMFQIYWHEKYKTRANVNRIRAESIHAPRGVIRDRNGIILSDNHSTYILSVIPGELRNKEEEFVLLSELTGLNKKVLEDNYNRYYRSRFVPVKIAKDLTLKQISFIEEHRLELPGVHFSHFQERYYPTGMNGAHFMGYLKEIDKSNWVIESESGDYEYGDLVGWQGIEKNYEQELRGVKGVNYYEVDAYNRIIGNVQGWDNILPSPGLDIDLTIDARLQISLEKTMEKYRGVAVASVPQTGEILAFVSSPDYPNSLFTGATNDELWQEILADTNKPLLNRIKDGLYPPGSTLKMIPAMILMENHLVGKNEMVDCVGKYTLGDRDFHCWKEEGHGEVNLENAIIQSCNVYFYHMSQRFGLEEWAELCRSFGFGTVTGIDLSSERKGIVPDPSYMNNRYGSQGWSKKGYMLNVSLGQGDILVTPLQMLQYINMIANRGETKTLHLTKQFKKAETVRTEIGTATWKRLEEYLTKVVNSQFGTGKLANPGIPGLTISGKTGTAQNPHGEHHAWFVGYGEKDGVKLSVVILIENIGHGGEFATPVARKLFSDHFQTRDFAGSN